MVEMTIGSRFYYKDKLCEVVETGPDSICGKCVFGLDVKGKCKKSKCYSVDRHDGKSVYFREVKE